MGPDSLFVIPNHIEPLVQSLRVLEIQHKSQSQKTIDKPKPTVQMNINKSQSPQEMPRRPNPASDHQNPDSKAFQSSLNNINVAAGGKQEQRFSALDSILRQNAKKQVLAESKKQALKDVTIASLTKW